jgi:pyroglutamyl-peptidase
VRVLLTGFAPIAALGDGENSSASAVLGRGDAPPGTATMALVLPVEWESAAALLLRVVDRCRPDAVISLGEGPEAIVEVERVAFNVRDWPHLPDNRGLVRADEPIALGAVERLPARVPIDPIMAALSRSRIAARAVDVRRPFICNEVFYRTLQHLEGTPVPVGFVHLPAATSPRALDPAQAGALIGVLVGETAQSLFR